MEQLFYTKLAKYYDKIYYYIDYIRQAKFILKLVEGFKTNKGNNLLDVACGTGTHIQLLKNHFQITGLDKNKEMLEIAKKKNPEIKFVQGDMQTFRLKERFDIILCYFNSILYNTTKDELAKTLDNFWSHLNKGGVLIFNSVDKIVGINSIRAKHRYRSKGVNILFEPQWIYKNKKLYIDIDFVIKGKSEEQLKDTHIMSAFGFNQIKNLAQKTGFKVNLLEQNYRKVEKLQHYSWQCVFVCEKP